MNDNDLANQLNNLPLEVGKELLWLVYRNLKPLTTISSDFDWSSSPISDNTKLNPDKERQVIDWVSTAGLHFVPSRKFANTLHLSKDKILLDKFAPLELDESISAHTFRGEAYGFGHDCAQAYAKATQLNPIFPNNLVIHAAMVPKLVSKDWYPYIGFLVRCGHELEDAQIAQTWAQTCRQDIPDIATQFEQNRLKDDVPFRQALQKIYQ